LTRLAGPLLLDTNVGKRDENRRSRKILQDRIRRYTSRCNHDRNRITKIRVATVSCSLFNRDESCGFFFGAGSACSQFPVIDRDHDAIAQRVRYLEFLRSLHDRRGLVFGVDVAEVSRRRSPCQAGAPSMLKVAWRGFSGLGHVRPPVPLALAARLTTPHH
jgi:hypothetical protein